MRAFDAQAGRETRRAGKTSRDLRMKLYIKAQSSKRSCFLEAPACPASILIFNSLHKVQVFIVHPHPAPSTPGNFPIQVFAGIQIPHLESDIHGADEVVESFLPERWYRQCLHAKDPVSGNLVFEISKRGWTSKKGSGKIR